MVKYRTTRAFALYWPSRCQVANTFNNQCFYGNTLLIFPINRLFTYLGSEKEVETTTAKLNMEFQLNEHNSDVSAHAFSLASIVSYNMVPATE